MQLRVFALVLKPSPSTHPSGEARDQARPRGIRSFCGRGSSTGFSHGRRLSRCAGLCRRTLHAGLVHCRGEWLGLVVWPGVATAVRQHSGVSLVVAWACTGAPACRRPRSVAPNMQASGLRFAWPACIKHMQTHREKQRQHHACATQFEWRMQASKFCLGTLSPPPDVRTSPTSPRQLVSTPLLDPTP